MRGSGIKRGIGIAANRRLVAVIAAVAVVVLASVAMWFLFRAPSPSEEAETYLRAVKAGNYGVAYSRLAESSQAGMKSPENLGETAIGALFSTGVVDQFTITGESVDGDRASVQVSLSKGSTEIPLTISLIRERGRWRVET